MDGEDGAPPPFPTAGAPAGCIWPAAAGREILTRLPLAHAVRRDDLVGRQGAVEGSGASDVVLYKAADWCLKTSRRRRFPSLDAARGAMVLLARKKKHLGSLALAETLLVLAPEAEAEDSAWWLWTVSPWVPTLRHSMAGAVERNDEATLAGALAAFAEAVVASLGLAASEGLQLDVHPSNFAISPDGLCYIDDDVGTGGTLPAIGHSILQRVEEYGGFATALEIYLSALEEMLSARLSAAQVRTLELTGALEQAMARSPAAGAARERLVRAVWRCSS